MKLRLAACSLCLAAVVLCAQVGRAGEPGEPEGTGTVQATYPRLTSGVLAGATLAELPDGVLLRVGDLEVTAGELQEVVANAPKALREQLQKNAFYLLEDLAARKLLLLAARQAAAQSGKELAGKSEQEIIEDYSNGLASQVKVTQEEVADFYEKNKDMCGGAELEQIRSELTQYVLQEKRLEVIARRPLELARTAPLTISAAWVKGQVPLAMDNPVDRARASGKPTLVDFGSTGCRPCVMMEAVMKSLTKDWGDKLNVVFVHVTKEPVLVARFGISSIPVQFIFNAEGQEVFRHTGFLPQDAIEEQLEEMGVQ